MITIVLEFRLEGHEIKAGKEKEILDYFQGIGNLFQMKLKETKGLDCSCYTYLKNKEK